MQIELEAVFFRGYVEFLVAVEDTSPETPNALSHSGKSLGGLDD